MAHVRRKFNDALNNDKVRASYALTLIQELYDLERTAQQANYDYQQRYELRQQKAVPILSTLGTWMKEQYGAVLPKSPIGKALGYSLKRWERLSLYTNDGKLLIDNNLVENTIRPLALGRKNFLFAGSHVGAQRIAMFYSFVGSCKLNNVNPYEWLKDVLVRIPTHPVNKIDQLLPHNWKPSTTPHTQNS